MSHNNLKVTEQSIPMLQEVTGFLKMFFAFYPIATDKELAYYVKDNALPPIGKNFCHADLERTSAITSLSFAS